MCVLVVSYISDWPGGGGKDDASLVSIHMQLVMGQFEYIQVLMKKLMPGLCNARGISLKN